MTNALARLRTDVTHGNVLRALDEYDRLGPEQFFAQHGFGPSRTYELVWNERRYPHKAILGTAYELAQGWSALPRGLRRRPERGGLGAERARLHHREQAITKPGWAPDEARSNWNYGFPGCDRRRAAPSSRGRREGDRHRSREGCSWVLMTELTASRGNKAAAGSRRDPAAARYPAGCGPAETAGPTTPRYDMARRDREYRPGEIRLRVAGMNSSYRRRQRQIAEVLVRYEMGHLLEIFGLERFVALERRLLGRGSARTRPESLRLALEELGPTFVKLGQVLSTRSDLLPADFQAELAKLQDNAVRVASEVIEETISSELGGPTSELFARFDPEPLAAASIGQVHAATLHDGTEVVIKVRRPEAAEEVELDLEIMRNLAARADQRWKEAQHWDLNGLARGFADLLRAELDYLQEAGNPNGSPPISRPIPACTFQPSIRS